MQIDDDLSMLPAPKPPLLCQYRSIWQLHSFCINYIFSVARVNPDTKSVDRSHEGDRHTCYQLLIKYKARICYYTAYSLPQMQ